MTSVDDGRKSQGSGYHRWQVGIGSQEFSRFWADLLVVVTSYQVVSKSKIAGPERLGWPRTIKSARVAHAKFTVLCVIIDKLSYPMTTWSRIKSVVPANKKKNTCQWGLVNSSRQRPRAKPGGYRVEPWERDRWRCSVISQAFRTNWREKKKENLTDFWPMVIITF